MKTVNLPSASTGIILLGLVILSGWIGSSQAVTGPVWTGTVSGDGLLYGEAVSLLGDVNGDGYSDIIVCAEGLPVGGNVSGFLYAYYGSSSGLPLLHDWSAELVTNQEVTDPVVVAAAGDVNGDGYDDLIASMPYFWDGTSWSGKILIYHGSAVGLEATPSQEISGESFGAKAFGWSIGTAGDVNGDGYADVIVGAPATVVTLANEGKAYLFPGSPAGISAIPSWEGAGDQEGMRYGEIVATAGDVNADGYADVIISSPDWDSMEEPPDNWNAGRIDVYHGSITGLSAGASYSAYGWSSGQSFAHSLSPAGDLNGDGYSDVIIFREGTVRAYPGGADGLYGAAWVIPYIGGGWFGEEMSMAGDLNGDGFADLIVSDPVHTVGLPWGDEEGAVYAYSGSPTGLQTTPVWGYEIDTNSDAHFGWSISTAGDVNGDGLSDLLVGAPGVDNPLGTTDGKAYLFYGDSGMPSTHHDWYLLGDELNGQAGLSVSDAGDLNGDGFGDLVTGERLAGVDNTGKAFISFGGLTMSSAADITLINPNNSKYFGSSLANAGDVNGDGYSDLIVGAPDQATLGGYPGSALLYFGGPAMDGVADLNFVGTLRSRFGASVSGAGDINGDGYADLIVGAPTAGSQYKGAAYIYLGGATMDNVADLVIWGNSPFDNLGTVSGAGDVNGDGFSDLLIGSTGAAPTGAAYLFLGSANPDGIADLTLVGEVAGDYFGGTVSDAGDVNGDGYSDILVGAYWSDAGGVNSGRVYLYHGGPSPDGVADLVLTGEGADDYLGTSISSAGDLNADGYGDIVIGSPTLTEQGKAYAYTGSAAGIDPVHAWSGMGSGITPERYGTSVSHAGDVNGDGFSDLIVGDPGRNGAYENAGIAYLYLGNEAELATAKMKTASGTAILPRQFDLAGDPIVLGGASDSPTSLRLLANGTSSAGRAKVRLEWKVAEQGTDLSTVPISHGAWFDTGHPDSAEAGVVAFDELVDGLISDTPYHWQLRIGCNSVFFPGTPWFTVAGSVPSETHLRTAYVETNIAGGDIVPAAPAGMMISPNPFNPTTSVQFDLEKAGEVKVTIYDIAGRLVRNLVDHRYHAGLHEATWNGRDNQQNEVGAGIYLVRLETGHKALTRKVALIR